MFDSAINQKQIVTSMMSEDFVNKKARYQKRAFREGQKAAI